MRNQEKRKKHSWGKWLILLVILAVLAGWLKGWIPGLGNGMEQIYSQFKGKDVTSSTTTSTTEQVKQSEIKVSGDKVYLDGNEIPLTELKAKLQAQKTSEVTIVDDGAIKATYDEVFKILNELNVATDR